MISILVENIRVFEPNYKVHSVFLSFLLLENDSTGSCNAVVIPMVLKNIFCIQDSSN